MRRLLTLLGLAFAFTAAPARAADWVYFDLGEVILTGKPATGYTYVPGALASLHELHAAGYQIGIISNTPQAWGKTCAAKFAYLQNFVATHLKAAPAFPWSEFAAVVQPPVDRYRKPQPLMFLRGLAHACPGRALYISETPSELTAAESVGYATFLKGPDPVVWPDGAAVARLLDAGFHFAYPGNCDLQPQVTAALALADRTSGMPDCVSIP